MYASRRTFLTGTALAAGGLALAAPADAAAPLSGAQGPSVYRYKFGDYQLTALYDGIWNLPIDGKFMRNASGRDVNRALAAAFLPVLAVNMLGDGLRDALDPRLAKRI